METWTMTKKDEQAVLVFERKIFRRIYGAKYEDGEWKSRMNCELEELSSVVGRGRSDRTDHDQQHCYHHVPTLNRRRLLQFIST
jgi:hypothetical protein